MSEWREIALDEIADEVTVGYVGPMASEYVSAGIPFLRSQNVEPFRINLDDTKFIAPSFHERLQKSALFPGDVVIVRTGKPGACAVIPESLTVSNCSDVVIVRCGPELDARFLMYYVNTVAAAHINSHLVGAVQQHFNVGAAKKLVLRLPQLREQRCIANVLSTLDDKIELNRRMNETLEAMARAIFQSWFVNFDPVRAKASGEPAESICQRLGLTPELLALFPDSFKDSELGEIPQGWRVTTLSEFCELNAKSWSVKTLPEEVNYVNLANTKNGVIQDVQTFTRSEAPSRARRILRHGDTIVGTVRPGNRSFALVGARETQLTGSTGFAVLSPRENCMAELVYLVATADDNIDRLARLADGGAYPAISPEIIVATECVAPKEAVLKAFHQTISTMMEIYDANNLANGVLADARDTLLPKLLSGELVTQEIEA